MKNMKKSIIIFGAVAIALLMTSSVTAVPQVNSEPVMEKIEELERPMSEQNLDGLFNFEGMDEESIEETISQLNDFMIEQGITGFDVQKLYTNFELGDFIDYLTSMEFADAFNSDEVQSFLNSDEYNTFYQEGNVATLCTSGEFNIFLNSDIGQQILENINGGDDSAVIVSQATQTQQVPLNTGRGNVILEGTATIGSQQLTQTSEDDADTLYAALLIGSFAYVLGDPEPLAFFQIIFLIALMIGLGFAVAIALTPIIFVIAAGVLFLGVIAVGSVIVIGGILIVIGIPICLFLLPFYILAVIFAFLFG